MIFIVLLIALVIRFISLNQSLWLDEGINVNVARALNFKSLFFDYSLSDFHPPLYHLILREWILLFGSSEISVRLPSVILGVATVFITYLIGKKLFENKTALIGATLLATSPLHIYYSQEARMYMLAAFLTSLSVYFFISILKKDNLWVWFGFVISTTLMLYTDYLPYLLIPVYLFYLLIGRKKVASSTLKSFIPAFILILILIVPWLIILPKQLQVGLSAKTASPAWAQIVGSPNLQNLAVTFVKFTIGRISYDNNLIYALLFAPAALFVIFLFLLSLLRMSYLRFFLWFWFFGPILIGFILAYFIPVFSYFRFIFILGAYYLIWSMAINTINWKPLIRILLSFALIINLTSSAFYLSMPRFQRENWREATSYVEKTSDENSLILFESPYTFGPFDYYNRGKTQAVGALENFNPSQSEVRNKLDDLTRNKNRIFLFQYLSQITDPRGLVFEELTKLGFNNIKTDNFNGVGFLYEFKR